MDERFEIEALAGSGGMADVYRARDRTTGALVALKVLRATGPEDLARLAREAQALTRLTHPGVVRYVAHGNAQSGEPFLAMEWVEGVTLSKRLRQGPLALATAVRLGRALAAALGHAHEHGIVHRDVKPANVVLRGGELDDPILLDFGVARTGLAMGLTQVGTVIGTPRYMAPEQARGAQVIDARADVFALGALVFKCMTGRAPFDGDDAIAVLAHLLFDDPPDVCDLVPGVPRAVGDVLAKMLAKEPEQRYPDGNSAMRALDALDTSDIPVTIAAPVPSGLTLRERRLLSLMVLTGKVDAEKARTVASEFGGRAEALANGSVVVVVSGRDNATELARVSARCALELRHAMPDAPIVLATGRGNDVDDDRTATISTDSTHSSRYSGVFERAAGLLRYENKELVGRMPIVIDDTTAGLLGSDFDIARGTGTSPHALRGRASRAQYTLLGKGTPFVGRARELSSLLATWADVCEQGVARAVVVTGEAGLGKSRLLYEMLAAMSPASSGATTMLHEQPALVLRAKADASNAGSPFAALGAAVRRAMGIGDDEPPADKWNKLAARVGSVIADGETHVAEFVAEVAGLRLPDPGEQVAAARRDPRLMGDRIRRSWQAWMRGEAARGPVLLVLEDFQWGDLPTVKLVEDMLHDLAEESIFVLALARPEIDTVFPSLWSRVVVRLPLVGLAKKAATTFVRTMLEGAPQETIERIVALASGNALHLEELVRSASEGKADAPESLLAILSAHVESLPDAERRVLRAASVFGATFWTDGVCALLAGANEANERTRAETNALLDGLARREMVGTHAETRLAGQRELAFRNALVRDVTYAMLTEDDRRLGHALAADWLERAGESDPFVLAEHRARAGQDERAVAEYARAAKLALDASDFGTAIDRARRAEACGASGDALAALLVVSAEGHRWRGETTECGADAKRALDLAARDSATYFRALRLYAYAASFAGNIEQVIWASDVLRDAKLEDDTVLEWVYALGIIANTLITTGHIRKNAEVLALASRISPERLAGDVELADMLRRTSGMRAYGRGDFTTMLGHLRQSAKVRLELGDLREHIIQVSNVGFAAMWLGRLDESLEAYETVRKHAGELRLATLELNAIQNGAFVMLCRGEPEAAVERSREVLARAKIEAPRSMALAHACCARALLALGRAEEAEPEARTAVDRAPTAVVRIYAQAVLADVLLGCRRIEERAASNDALALLRTFGTHVVGDVYTFLVRAEILEADGDPEGARETIVEGRALFDERRRLLPDDAARATFDAWTPDAKRLLAAHARLAD
jgi:tetratricopeptide (TPR) repeat protein